MKSTDGESTINSEFKNTTKILAIMKKNASKPPKYLKVIQKGKTKYFSIEDDASNSNCYFCSITRSYECHYNNTLYEIEDHIELQ